MRVQLSIQDDKEMRNLIKDMIKGQVKSVAREEIRSIIAEVFGDKIDRYHNTNQLIQTEVQRTVSKTLDNATYGKPSALKEIAREEVQKILKDLFASTNPLVGNR